MSTAVLPRHRDFLTRRRPAKCSAIASGLLSELNVDTQVCGGIGEGAQVVLAEAGIRLYGGVSGSANEAVEALLAGRLAYDPDVHCDHHGHHGEGHRCGEDKHSCVGNGGRS